MSYTAKESKLFPCNVVEITDDNFKEYKDSLTTYIENYKDSNPSVQKSNAGGYQSNSSFMQDENFRPFFEKFFGLFEHAFRNYFERSHICPSPEYRLINAWINVNSSLDHNYFHCHAGSDVSGVFWVKADKNSGSLVFPNPNQYSQWYTIEEEHKIFEPEEGKLLLFPASMNHFVTRNLSDTTRISLSFNFKAV